MLFDLGPDRPLHPNRTLRRDANAQTLPHGWIHANACVYNSSAMHSFIGSAMMLASAQPEDEMHASIRVAIKDVRLPVASTCESPCPVSNLCGTPLAEQPLGRVLPDVKHSEVAQRWRHAAYCIMPPHVPTVNPPAAHQQAGEGHVQTLILSSSHTYQADKKE